MYYAFLCSKERHATRHAPWADKLKRAGKLFAFKNKEYRDNFVCKWKDWSKDKDCWALDRNDFERFGIVKRDLEQAKYLERDGDGIYYYVLCD